MSYEEQSMHGFEMDGHQKQGSNFLINVNNSGMNISTRKLKEDGNFSYVQDHEDMEHYLQARAQEEEICYLREQITVACLKELQLLNDKCALERKFSDLRMAIDEKQNEAIISASNELAHRKGDLEENFKLVHDLKVVEDDRYIFTSSMLGLLAEYGFWPPVVNASSITNSVKHLHDQLQLKIRSSHDRIREITSKVATNVGNASVDKENFSSGILKTELGHISMGQHGFSPNNHHPDDHHLMHINDPVVTRSSIISGQANHQLSNGNKQEFMFSFDSESMDPAFNGAVDKGIMKVRAGEMTNHALSHPLTLHDEISPATNEEGPGIEGFQIVGYSAPGEKLLGCGYPVRETTLCMFQWVRHLEDGTRQYIEGATNPEYVVTADDVDKLLAVECIPMDDRGRQGELVRIFANEQNKIKCDPEMQMEIDTYISKGQATFSVVSLIDYFPENWGQAEMILRRSGFQVKVGEAFAVQEKYSKELTIKIPGGLSTQFVVTCSDGSSHAFSTNHVRNRDALVLTLRTFQRKALDEKRKGKA
ncbi:hypothetical protein SLA2020_325400 [Shorea laevis]